LKFEQNMVTVLLLNLSSSWTRTHHLKFKFKHELKRGWTWIIETAETAAPFPAPEKGGNQGLSPFHPQEIIVMLSTAISKQSVSTIKEICLKHLKNNFYQYKNNLAPLCIENACTLELELCGSTYEH
jgi:hypothetical protein